MCAIGCSLVALVGGVCPTLLIFMAMFFTAVMIFLIIKQAKAQFLVITVIILITVCSTVSGLGEIKRQSKFDGLECKGQFIVQDIKYEGANFYCADIKISKSDVLERGTKLSVYYEDGKLALGDKVNAKMFLSKVDGAYKTSDYSKNIFLNAKLYDFEVLKGQENKLLKSVNSVRNYIKDAVFNNLSYSSASTLCALILGEKGYFSNQFSYNVTASGVNHVMVISGMHLTIFMVLFMSVVSKFSNNRYLRAFMQLFAVFIVSSLCGFTVSILRAGVMYIIMSIGFLIKRKTVAENILGAACSFILAFNPFVIFNVAFRLSVLSTFGIVAVALPITTYLKENKIIRNRFLSFIAESVLISLSATVLTLPVIISNFGFISSVGIATTLIITYPVTFSIWISIFALLINLLSGGFAGIIFIPCEYLLKFTNFVINKMGSLPFSVVPTDKIWALVAVGIIILIFYVLLACKKRLDMIKLKEMREKILRTGGGKLKWQ